MKNVVIFHALFKSSYNNKSDKKYKMCPK